MRHLSMFDLNSISTLACQILGQKDLNYGSTYCLKIGGKKVKIKLQKSNKNISENGAEITPLSNTITLSLAEVDLTTNRKEMKKSISSLLIHEATHLMRLKSGCRKNGEAQEAVRLACCYKQCPSEKNYIAYVRCAEEKPPHAAQLAMEMRESKIVKQDPTESWLYAHFKMRCSNPEDETNIKKLIKDLAEYANCINEELSSQA